MIRRNLGNLIVGFGASLEDLAGHTMGFGKKLSVVADRIVGIGCRVKFKGDDHPAFNWHFDGTRIEFEQNCRIDGISSNVGGVDA